MDWMNIRKRCIEVARKYRYAILVVMVGLVLMLLPNRKENKKEPAESTQSTSSSQPNMAQMLEEILGQIDGAGKVKVMLTEFRGEEMVYQSDEDTNTGENSGSIRRDTVLITGTDRQQEGLVRQINPPVYRGAIVVCQGADKASVRLAITEAVKNVTGLGTDCISVLKMK